MSSQREPMEIDCDAPPYTIVRACQQIGFRTPEDVRWCRLSELPQRRPTWRDLVRRLLRGWRQPRERTCTCAAPLPRCDRFTFTLRSGAKIEYSLGQCGRCRTIFWEPVPG